MAHYEYKAFAEDKETVITDDSSEVDLAQQLEDIGWDDPFLVSTVELLDRSDIQDPKVEYIHRGVDSELREYASLSDYKKYLYDSGQSVTQWADVHDPKGEVEVAACFADISHIYEPDEVQQLIYRNGIVSAVREINQKTLRASDHFGLKLTNVNKVQKQLTDAKISHLY